MIEIVEIIRRSEQGVTRPYICRGSDGNLYYVKGRGASRRSLVCEWIAGNLARHFDLPIAPFKIVTVPAELVESSPEYDDLGEGLAFGSQECKSTELTYSNLREIPQQLQLDILVFDWWIKNGDRNLTSYGGNPNLLWDPGSKSLIVIDHNQAFDENVNKDTFCTHHVFGPAARSISNDLFKRDEYNARLERAAAKLSDIAQSVPKSWWYTDDRCIDPIAFQLTDAKEILYSFSNDDFWTRNE